jgi:hypothetical protein
VDNNILLSPLAIRDSSQGGAFLHNLIGGRVIQASVLERFTFYHFPHSTQVAGLMTIAGGDTRYRNNICLAAAECLPRGSGEQDVVDDDGNRTDNQGIAGTAVYDGFPVGFKLEPERMRTPADWAAMKLPVDIRDNWYGPGTRSYTAETGAILEDRHDIAMNFHEVGNEVRLRLDVPPSLVEHDCPVVNAASLGVAFQPEASFETPDAKPLIIDTDYHDQTREGPQVAGPFAGLSAGKQEIVVWPR